MDFFASQDQARSRSRWLTAYFILAVVGVICAVYAIVWGVGSLYFAKDIARNRFALPFYNPPLFGGIAFITATVIGLGSLYKTMQLSAGGGVVARDLGGRQISRDTTDPMEQRLLNVVEEMALAAGMPVPDVYVLDDEEGINAFAAGYTPANAAIGITRGALKHFTREELQGVIAHEFSHILNGDMRLNTRIIGLIFGIMVIYLTGKTVLNAAQHSGGRDDKGRLVAFITAAAIMAVGWMGVLFARMIQAAISRQREFLADASAVQFTRNPEGIAKALIKIGGLGRRGGFRAAMAEEASHLFFCNIAGNVQRLLATHPPLDERIRAVFPAWDGKFPTLSEVRKKPWEYVEKPYDSKRNPPRPNPAGSKSPLGSHMAFAPHPTESVDRMGQFGAPELSSAGNLLQALPEQWQNLLNHPEGAKSLIFAVLISESEALRNQELEILAKNVDPEALQLVKLLHPQFVEVSSAVLIATLDLAIPALRRMTPQEYDKFSDTLQLLISSDFEIDLFEFMIQKMLRRHLDLYFRLVADPKPIFHKPAQIIAPARIVISLLSTLAGRGETDRRAAFMEGSRSFSRFGVNLGDPMGDIGLAHLDEALNQLNKADFRIKQQFLQACGRTIMADGIVSDHEAEMVRAIADSIGCPLPPFAHSLVA